MHGAIIGAFGAFGVDGALAVVAVLAYRACQDWLPIVPGVLAYLRLFRTVKAWEVTDGTNVTQSV